MYSGDAWFAGFNCKQDGSGFESQLFLDNSCTVYAPTMSNYYPFSSAVQSDAAEEEGQEEVAEGEEEDAAVAEDAEAEQSDVVDYTYRVASDNTPYMIQNADYFTSNPQYCEGEQGQEGQQAGQQADQFCQKLFDVSVDAVTCLGYGEEVREEAAQQEEEPCECEGQVEGEEGAEPNCDCAEQSASDYQIRYEDVGDVANSCSSLQRAFQFSNSTSYADAEYIVSKWRNVEDGHQPSTTSSSSGKWWIIGVVLAAVVALALCFTCRRKNLKKKPLIDTNDKREPLVSSAKKPSRVSSGKSKMKKESIEIYFQGSPNQKGADC
jgi:hypothetical protein